ncbi:aromatic ring-hydroxylating dioxygenase subunit alpha [Pseudonocardia hispaniensis]|uniref:Aromatic ring-hydroxylating dioxygenase subunit alpha n=1 Tax=Pseudonocardia hispaniensis TaxID=904933 RepID=A0ABW1IXV1_9PSEU
MVGADRVEAQVYLDPDIFELELERIFYKTWNCVGHESEVAEPGSFKTLEIGRRPVIVSRDRAGLLNVMLNRCRHRGATLCEQPRGTMASGFTCPYHSWSYALDGRLRGIPYPDGYPASMDKSALSLTRLRVATYQGLIFANFDEDAEPLEDFLGDARKWIDLFMRQGAGYPVKVQGAHRFRYRANWKVQLENVTDGYHFPLVHRSWMANVDAETADMLAFMKDPEAVTYALGNGHSVGIMVPEHVDLDEDDGTEVLQDRFAGLIAELEGKLPADEIRRVVRSLHGAGFNLTVFPNLALSMGFIRILNPVSVDTTDNAHMALGYGDGPAGADRERLRIHEHFQGPFGFGTPDDAEVWARVQRGAAADPAMPIMLNRGLNREVTSQEGHQRSHITDETGMREAYAMWKRLMTDAE